MGLSKLATPSQKSGAILEHHFYQQVQLHTYRRHYFGAWKDEPRSLSEPPHPAPFEGKIGSHQT
ncbi:MAG: hypothetical protein V2G44_05935 [bacterium JZ-2024 1]